MKGNDSWVEAHPAWLNSTLVLSSASVSTSKERSVPIHSGGPARQRQATPLAGRLLGDLEVESDRRIGKRDLHGRSDPIRASVWLLLQPFMPSDVRIIKQILKYHWRLQREDLGRSPGRGRAAPARHPSSRVGSGARCRRHRKPLRRELPCGVAAPR